MLPTHVINGGGSRLRLWVAFNSHQINCKAENVFGHTAHFPISWGLLSEQSVFGGGGGGDSGSGSAANANDNDDDDDDDDDDVFLSAVSLATFSPRRCTHAKQTELL